MTPLSRIPAHLSHANVLISVSKGIWAMKLCCSKILQLLTACAS